MKTEKGHFLYRVSDEILIDLGEIDEQTWTGIKKNVRAILKAKQTNDIGMAYIAAFIIYLSEVTMMADPYDPNADLFN